MIEILLVDDHDIVRRGLRNLVESTHPVWKICGEASNGREAVELAVRLKPDVTVMDLAMPEMGGLEACLHIRRLVPSTEILVYSMSGDRHHIVDAVTAGVSGYVLKSGTSEHLVAAIEAVARHEDYFSGVIDEGELAVLRRGQGQARPGPAPTGWLTPRQREVVQHLAAGRSNKQIASTCGISVNTVKTHRAAIMRRLDASSIVDVVRWAIDHGLIEPQA